MIDLHSISLQPLWKNRHEYYDLIKRDNFGLEIVSFASCKILNNPVEMENHFETYMDELSQMKTFKSLHAPFLDLIIHSLDEEVASMAKKRIYKAVQIAENLSCSHVVAHVGFNTLIRHKAYFEHAISVHSDFWRAILDEFKNITICLENMWESNTIIFERILEQVNHPRLKVCLDVGHVNIFSDEPLISWFDKLKDSIAYMHLNDNNGDVDSEMAIGDGNIQWREFLEKVKKMDGKPQLVLEVGSIERVNRSMDYLKSINFFET